MRPARRHEPIAGPAAESAQAILIAHQPNEDRSCLCGWSELGRYHAGHQVQMLAQAGLLAADPEVTT